LTAVPGSITPSRRGGVLRAQDDQGGREDPQYPALARSIDRVTREMRAELAICRRRWFAAVGLEDPGRSPALAQEGLSAREEKALDAAIEAFLAEMAGPPPRGKATFTSEKAEGALVQQANFHGNRVGVVRAADQVGREAKSSLTEAVKRELAENSFARMSSGGKLRFERDLERIRQEMIEGFDRGDSPAEIARKLAEDLTSYERARLDVIARNEVAIASEAAITKELKAQGVTRVTFAIDPGTDETCTQHIDQVVSIDDPDMPPWHVNCLCSQLPVLD
jgi:Phage Mu protein F like protein